MKGLTMSRVLRGFVETSNIEFEENTAIIEVPLWYLETLVESLVNNAGVEIVPLYDELSEEEYLDLAVDCHNEEAPYFQEHIEVEIDYEIEEDSVYTMVQYTPYFNLKTLEIYGMREDFMEEGNMYELPYFDTWDYINDKLAHKVRDTEETDQEELELTEIMKMLFGIEFELVDAYHERENKPMLVYIADREEVEEKLM